MADTIVDLEVRRKQNDGSYKIYHPITKAINVKCSDGSDLESVSSGYTNHKNNNTHVGYNEIASVKITKNQSIPNDLDYAIFFDYENFDRGNVHNNSTNLPRFTIANSGKYIIIGHLYFDVVSTVGKRSAIIKKNGGYIASQEIQATNSSRSVIVTTLLELQQNDYVELYAYQNSGGSVNVQIANFMIVKVG